MMAEQEREAEERNDDSHGDAREIRFLKEKRRRGPGMYVFAVLLLVAALVYAHWYRETFEKPIATQDAIHAPSLLVDRIWIDEIPQRESDKFHLYLFSSEDNFGINDKAASIYKHLLEIFFYDASGTTLSFQFPHDRRNSKTSYKVEKLSKPKDDVDLKLTITADPQMNGKNAVYYSSTKWSSVDRSTMPQLLQKAIPSSVIP
jgi:hypothetical protein